MLGYLADSARWRGTLLGVLREDNSARVRAAAAGCLGTIMLGAKPFMIALTLDNRQSLPTPLLP